MMRASRMLRALLQIVILSLLFGCGSDRNDSSSHVLAFSDVHFNPFYDPVIFDDLMNSPGEEWAKIFETSSVVEPGSWGNETNYPLLVETLTALEAEASKASLAVFPGDILTHQFGEKFVSLYGKEDKAAQYAFAYKTVKFFASQLRNHLGDLPIVFALGNNDGYEDDYKMSPGNEYFSDTADELYNLFLLGETDYPSYLETYKAGGYFSSEVPSLNVSIICLNTVFFSPNADPGINSAISTELDWLEEALADAREKGGKVWLVMHIPPGIDIYSTISKYMDSGGHISDAVMMWSEDIQQRYLEIIRNNSDIIEIGFAGHTHMDEFRLSLNETATSSGSIVVVPSISPLFANNPAYKVISFSSDNGSPNDYRSIAYSFVDSRLKFKDYYTFSKTYGLKGSLDQSLGLLFPLLNTDQRKRLAYTGHYYSGHNSSKPLSDAKWKAYWCGAGHMLKEDFIDCVNNN